MRRTYPGKKRSVITNYNKIFRFITERNNLSISLWNECESLSFIFDILANCESFSYLYLTISCTRINGICMHIQINN